MLAGQQRVHFAGRLFRTGGKHPLHDRFVDRLRDASDTHTIANRQRVVARRRIGLSFKPLADVAGCARVGNVVADDRQTELAGLQSGISGLNRTEQTLETDSKRSVVAGFRSP